jgi:hypothetical protein
VAEIQLWDLWYPNAGSQGLPFARGRLRETHVLLAHALPDTIRVEVRDEQGRLLAFADQLERTAERPMACLVRNGSHITRVDLWPEEDDLGRPVILPGGEVGILCSWWNAPDGQEWRWQVEFYNHRRR